MIRVLSVPVGKPPAIVEVDGTLECYQSLVGGWLEAILLPGTRLDLVCNEEGGLKGLPINRQIGGGFIRGDFFITATDPEGEWRSLTDAEVEQAKRALPPPILPSWAL